MCTVTYLPKSKGNFILNSSRDEALWRGKPIPPQIHIHQGKDLLFPMDVAGGTWIGATKNQRTACLLNGALERHDRHPPYRKSRGMVVLDALAANDLSQLSWDYDLQGIEPFTLIILNWEFDFTMQELIWNGTHRFVRALNPDLPAIWSSYPLYTATMQEKRRGWFKEWLEIKPDFDLESSRHFHKTAGEGNPISNLITERGFLKTRSITSVEKSDSDLKMIFEDLEKGEVYYGEF